jgi:hypothetical protein
MTTLDTLTYGAKAQSLSEANPRNLLKRIMDANPGADKDTLFGLVFDELLALDSKSYWRAIAAHWFANEYTNLTRTRPSEPVTEPEVHSRRKEREEAKQRAAEAAGVTVEAIKAKVSRVFLSGGWLMPNGEALRDCTFGYVASLGERFTALASQGKPNQVIRSVLSDEQLAAL